MADLNISGVNIKAAEYSLHRVGQDLFSANLISQRAHEALPDVRMSGTSTTPYVNREDFGKESL